MAAVYPGTVATIASNKADGTTAPTDHPGHHNQLAEELVATQTELGTNPSLAATTVATLNSALMSRWTPMFEGHVNLSAAVAGTYPAHRDVTTNALIGAASPQGYTYGFVYIDPADYAITGFTMKMRLIASFSQNAVANAGTSVMTAGLYPYVGAGATTTWLATLGTVITGSTAALTGGGASSESRVISSTFTAPTADTYALAVVVSVAQTGGSTRINCRLEYNYA